MPPGRATTIGQLMRAAAVALVLALLLSRMTAVQVGAEPRGPGVANANAFIDWCIANGGSPDTGYDPNNGSLIVGDCRFSDGSRLQCKFWLDGDVSCVAQSPSGDWHYVNPPDGVGIAPPLIRPGGNNFGYHGGHGTLQFSGGGTSGTSGTGSGGTTLHTAQAGDHSPGPVDKHAGQHRHGGTTPKRRHGHGGKK